jgi:UPF0755 protein
VRRFFLLVFFALALALGAGAWWLNQPLGARGNGTDQAGQFVIDLSIEPGTTARAVAQAVADAGLQVNPTLLYGWFRVSGQARQIKAGSYEIDQGATPYGILQKLVRGDEALRAVTLVEGWTFSQVRSALSKAEQLKTDTRGLEPDLIMEKLGKPGTPAEGRFYPDTYTYAKGSSDLAVLKRALRAMDKQLDAAWHQRLPDSPLKSPDELLTLASIVEKETGRGSDRPQIAGVFTNRLKIGMLLQTDPTVIYGMGDKFDGNLRKRDLLADTPWNTYTRAGLPPTPIAMPGKAALAAAVQPAQTKALYFVARGDGSSQFSATLEEHNRAVNKFQRGK